MHGTTHAHRAASAIALLLIHAATSADSSCLQDPIVKERIRASEAIDKCFADDGAKECLIHKMSIDVQRRFNAKRLIPFDRSTNELMNTAAGAVEVDIPHNRGHASGQKISRCHVVTSAHVLYTDTRTSVEAFDSRNSSSFKEHRIEYRSGQTCSEQSFEKSSTATVYFRTTTPEVDFVCDRMDNEGKCLHRRFFGKSDLVILRLDKYDKADGQFFGLDINSKIESNEGDWINCWGYPGYNNQLSWIPKALSDQLLWFQKSAKIFPGNYDRGILTSAIAYPGMSGGGCARQSHPNRIFAILTSKNSLTGNAGLLITENNVDEFSANFVSPLDYFAQRFKAATGKDLQSLDEECD